jgi:hypothetical protein
MPALVAQSWAQCNATPITDVRYNGHHTEVTHASLWRPLAVGRAVSAAEASLQHTTNALKGQDWAVFQRKSHIKGNK